MAGVLRRVAPWAVLAALVVAPAAGVAALVLRGDSTPSALQPPAVPLSAEPAVSSGDDPIDALIQTTFGPAPQLRSIAGSGLVTASWMEVGRKIENGDRLFAVAGVRRYALVAASPPYRELSVGSRGADVQALERFLGATGAFEAEPDDRYDSATAAAVHEWRRAAGETNPPWTFSPDLVVWVPTAGFMLGKVEVEVGAPVPAPGESVGAGQAVMLSAVVTDPNRQVLQVDWPRIVSVNGRDIGTITDPAEIPPELATALVQAAAPETAADDDGGDDSGRAVPVVLRLAEPVSGLTVPASAVMVDAAGGETCVWVGEGAPYESVPVVVVGGTLGASAVTGDISGRMVLSNPLQILPDAQCPSR